MWRDDDLKINSPVVVGGLGGSGTRVVAQILQALNYYIGSYLNPQLDNLWFTFLLRRPAKIRTFYTPEIIKSLKLFDSVMKSYWGKSFRAKTKLYELAVEFMLHNYVKRSRYKFPFQAVRSISHHHYQSEQHNWGWKEPNTHLFIEPLYRLYPDMKFILVLRHPLDMMFGNNFNQLYNWYHLFNLPKPNKRNEKELMLLFYDAAYSRAIHLGQKLLKNNFCIVKIEELSEGENETKRLLKFLKTAESEKYFDIVKKIPNRQLTFGRYKKDITQAQYEQYEPLCKKFNYNY